MIDGLPLRTERLVNLTLCLYKQVFCLLFRQNLLFHGKRVAVILQYTVRINHQINLPASVPIHIPWYTASVSDLMVAVFHIESACDQQHKYHQYLRNLFLCHALLLYTDCHNACR